MERYYNAMLEKLKLRGIFIKFLLNEKARKEISKKINLI